MAPPAPEQPGIALLRWLSGSHGPGTQAGDTHHAAALALGDTRRGHGFTHDLRSHIPVQGRAARADWGSKSGDTGTTAIYLPVLLPPICHGSRGPQEGEFWLLRQSRPC